MSQKSLPALNKVNTSMIWYVTYYYKYYKWLSNQYIYMLYFLNKLFVYLDFFFSKLFWNISLKNYFYKLIQRNLTPRYTKVRFFYPVTAYFVRLSNCNIFFNIFYKTSLDKFQSYNRTVKPALPYNIIALDYSLLSKMYYM